ncbi:hypothetical protein NX059_008455 [Plenodomus lindquistii]|nr:hypothetical protein NX059_008455 [Plenodomus lindquistii]
MPSSSSPYDRIKAHYENYTSLTEFIVGDKPDESTTNLEKDVEKLNVDEKSPAEIEEQHIQAVRREFLNVGGKEEKKEDKN